MYSLVYEVVGYWGFTFTVGLIFCTWIITGVVFSARRHFKWVITRKERELEPDLLKNLKTITLLQFLWTLEKTSALKASMLLIRRIFQQWVELFLASEVYHTLFVWTIFMVTSLYLNGDSLQPDATVCVV